MEEKGLRTTKAMAWTGTVLLCVPILLTLVTSLIGSLSSGRFLMDILMPAELFPIELGGAAFLVWSSRRSGYAKSRIAWGTGVMIGGLFASQGMAFLTGLARGDAEPEGWRLMVVMALMAVFVLAVISLCITGVRLIHHLNQRA